MITNISQVIRLARFLFIILFICCTVRVHAQLRSDAWYFGVKFMGLSFHPGNNPNAGFYKRAFGKHKRLVLNLGAVVMVEYRFAPHFGVKIEQAVFFDCANKFMGISMINLRYAADLGPLGEGSAGLGPVFFYRRSWTDFGDYEDDGYFRLSPNGRWQKKFVWYGGELEHNYPLGNGFDLSTNIFPGYPVVYALSSGVRYSPAVR